MSTSALRNLEVAKAALADAEADVNAERANRRILCCCGKMHSIKSLDLIVTHFYISPHGCTGGDYWLEGEWNFVCPKGVNNRLLFNDDSVDWKKRDTVDVAAEPTFKRLYRRLFKSSTDEHKAHSGRPNNINYYVDKNRKKFELPEVRET